MVSLSDVLSIDRDLGLGNRPTSSRAAVVLYRPIDEGQESSTQEVAATIVRVVKAWAIDVLQPWAETHSMGALAIRVTSAVATQCIDLAAVDLQLLERGPSGKTKPLFHMIARQLGERLAGEELFEGCGAVDIVVNPTFSPNSVELMTPPKLGQKSDVLYSMVARLTVVTLPYSDNLYLRVAASKRVWAKRAPGRKPNGPRQYSGYVWSPARPVMEVPIRRGKDGWSFGEEYESFRLDSAGRLHETVEQAIASRRPDESGWWVGLPELTTLYDSVSQRTTLESDELDLLKRVSELLGTALEQGVDHREVRLPRQKVANQIAMLKLADLVDMGVAGYAVVQDAEDSTVGELPTIGQRSIFDADESEGLEVETEDQRIDEHRAQNMRALRMIHGDQRPTLWMFGGGSREQELVSRCVAALFGEAVELRSNPLPVGAHGLRQAMPLADETASRRFDARVAAWKTATAHLKTQSGPRYALICAADREGNKSEDLVNYFAGIHAMCKDADANVHHVLPIEGGDAGKQEQNFVHRVQSALLDVFFAHSGVVFGVQNFVSARFNDRPPRHVYGVQAVRSKARAFSGEGDVSFLVFTRLGVETGISEVQYAYREGTRAKRTQWLPLNEGLRWLGSQRQISGDETWLKACFAERVKELLSAIEEVDKRALVLIDWTTVRGLWNGISDFDLGAGIPPRLDGKDLRLAYPELTLVRLRRGPDTMALRARSTSTFELVPEDVAASSPGETRLESYATTGKSLVQLTPSSLIGPTRGAAVVARPRHGHYLMSMGYRKTVQMTRGQSSYRAMQRLRRVDGPGSIGKLYSLGVLPPADKDAALPAPLEVTVMSSPADVSPDEIAITIMGLRLGYAHYSEWTSLPAPLFFKRKIDDYIIRYSGGDSSPDAEAMEFEVGVDSGIEGVAGAEAPPVDERTRELTRVVLHDREQVLQAPSSSSEPDESAAAEKSVGAPALAAEVAPLGDRLPSTGPADSVSVESTAGAVVAGLVEVDDQIDEAVGVHELLTKAKSLAPSYTALYGSSADWKRRQLYFSMITGVAPVQVDLPIFVTQASLFDGRDAYDKKTLERFWKDQRYMGFASDKATKPSAGDLPDWVFARLRTPQSLFSLDGSRLFPPNDPLLRVLPIAWERFQTAQAEVSGDDISEEISVFDLGKWASAQSDDETLAWIIFLAAQRPGRESASALFEELESLPGPASESAVQYFIACAQACAEALEQRKEPGRTFRRIVKRLPRNDDATSEQISVEQNDGGMPSMAMSPVAMAVQSLGPVMARKLAPLGGEKAPDIPPGSGGPSILNASAPKQGGVEEMAAKAEIIRLLESVSVGANSFAEGVAAIEAQLAVLKHLHEDALLASERARAADEEAELARRAEQEAIEQRAIWWASTSRRASELISRVQSSIPDLHDLRIAVVDSTTQDASEIDASLDSVDAVVEAAIQAEIAAESAATTEAPAGLKPRERSQFRLEAAQKASAALNASIAELETNLRRCPVLIVGDGTPSDPSPRPIEVDVQCATDTVAEPDSPADIVESSSSRADAIAADLSGLIGANAGVGEHTATATARAPKSLDNEPEADGNRPTSSPDALAESEPLTQHPDPTHANTVASQTFKTVGTAEPPEVRSEQSEVAQQDQPPKEAPNSGESDSEIVDEAWLDDQFGPLQRFLDSRRYALGQVQVDALLQIVRSDSPFASDAVLLKGGFAATASLDSRASVDFRLSDDMEGYLTNGSVPTTHASEALSPYLGVLAATLGSALFESPGDGVRWMVLSFLKAGVTGHPPLEALVKHLEGMNHSGLILTRELVAASKVGAKAAATAEVRRLRERAASWKSDDEIFNNWTAPDYREIHDAMFSDKFSIGKCVALVAKGDDKGVAEAFGDAKRRIEKGSATLADLCKRVGRRRPVEGVGRDHMMDNMNATKAFVTRYFEAVERVKKPSGDLPSNLVAFLTELYRELASAISYVREFPPADSLDTVFRNLAVAVLTQLQRLLDDREPDARQDDDEQLLTLQAPIGAALRPVFSISSGSTTLSDTLVCDARELLVTLEELSEEFPTPMQALKDHIAAERILPARVIEHRLGKAGGAGTLGIELAHKKARNRLDGQIQDVSQKVTHAMSLSALTQSEATHMHRVIEEIKSANVAEIGNPAFGSSKYADYPQARAVLLQQVVVPLDQRLIARSNSLAASLDQWLSEEGRTPVDLANASRVRSMLSDAKNASSIRAAHDAFNLLRDGIMPAHVAPQATATEQFTSFVDQLRKFAQSHLPIVEALADALKQDISTNDPPWAACLDRNQRDEATSFLRTWAEICASKNPAAVEETLRKFATLIGLVGDPTCTGAQPRNHRVEFFLQPDAFVGIEKTAVGVFLPPSLGSMAKHIQGWVIRNKPTDQDLGNLVTEVGQVTPTVILARTSLTLQKRAIICRGSQAILVDDNLVAYLAVHPDSRAARLLQVALLTFHTNPYDDYGMPVPREMFFGREAELTRLRNVKSSAILFGGRRLGKSSLLDQIQQDSLSRRGVMTAGGRSGEVAIYIAMETKIDSAAYGADHVAFAWKAIQRAVVSAGLLDQPKSDLSSATAIQDWMETEFKAGRAKASGCFLLIDEADALMGRDIQSDTAFMRSLTRLQENVRTQFSIRYVIAGLHNLTRMSTDENSVLGKADAIALKPFWSSTDIKNGIALITKPLAALGFHFAKGAEDLPLRIMAVCNFYPAFIQLYCKSLVEKLYNKRQNSVPPTEINAAVIDSVEKDSEFLGRIQELFKLNLNLDKRYKAIALILADRYYSEETSGGPRGLTVSEIRDHCELLAKQHFEKTGPGAYEALLDEMEKLAVLERDGPRYQLRTPHIATLIGNQTSVWEQLDGLTRETAVDSRMPGESRIVMQFARERMLFPMPSAWVHSNLEPVDNDAANADADLLILVGNNLSGLHRIGGLRDPWRLGESALYEVKIFGSADRMKQHLTTVRRKPSQPFRKMLLAAKPGSWGIDDIESYAQVAAQVGRGNSTISVDGFKSKPPRVRLALIASPEVAYQLACHVSEDGFSTNRVGWRVERVPEWNDDALYFHLGENVQVRDDANARKCILDATCGFGIEIERISSNALSVEQAVASVRDNEARLAPDLATFYRKVGVPEAVSVVSLRCLEQALPDVDGATRADPSVSEWLKDCGVAPGVFTFATWMGLVQPSSDGKWKVPQVYKRLLG